MSLRPAAQADAPAIEAFLAARAESSMFLRASLHRFGPEGGGSDRAMKMWVNADGPVAGVIGHAPSGYVSVQMPCGVPDTLRRYFAGMQVLGVNGPVAQATDVVRSLELSAELHAEPLCRLPLARVSVPEGPGHLRPVTMVEFDRLAPWRQAYRREIDGFETSLDDVRDWFEAWVRDDRLRVLEEAGTPLAITGFNAVLPDTVQVGAVYTPPDLRGRGYARRAVALHLAEARENGVKLAILFAASPAASRAYESIGFTQVGHFGMLQLARPQRIAA